MQQHENSPKKNPQACPICKSMHSKFLLKAKDYFIRAGQSDDFSIYICDSCEVGFTTPPMNDDELAHYYPKDYESYTNKRGFRQFIQAMKYRFDIRLLRKIAPSSTASIFEIGAGRGEFLSQAKSAGFQVSGLEPGESGRNEARKKGINLLSCYASELHFKEKYDVVAIRHVLEHINEARSVLNNIFENGLASEGYLFLKLPRLNSWEARFFKSFWHGFDLPRHRLHFSARSIKNLLASIGFKEVKVTSEVVPLDIERSLRYILLHGSSPLKKFLARMILLAPSPLSTIVCQICGLVFSPFGAGRMIVTAKKFV